MIVWNRLRYTIWAPAYDALVGTVGFAAARRVSIERLKLATWRSHSGVRQVPSRRRTPLAEASAAQRDREAAVFGCSMQRSHLKRFVRSSERASAGQLPTSPANL